MRILSLTAKNILRLKAAHIKPDGSTVIVGGKNAAGKTSVLQCISMALEGGRSKQPTSEDMAAAAELSQALERALERLSDEHRQVLMLRTMHGLSSKETAEIVGLDESQVRSHLSYARKRLKVFLAELYEAPIVVRGEELAR